MSSNPFESALGDSNVKAKPPENLFADLMKDLDKCPGWLIGGEYAASKTAKTDDTLPKAKVAKDFISFEAELTNHRAIGDAENNALKTTGSIEDRMARLIQPKTLQVA